MPHIELPPPPRRGGNFFKDDAGWWHNAVLDTYGGGWYIYAEVYRRAADVLLDRLRESRVGLDFLIYPIVFLYRQYLELSLKTIIFNATRLADEEPALTKLTKTHKLDTLWRMARDKAQEVLEEHDMSDAEIIDNCVTQLANVDPAADAFRYPVGKDGTPVQHPMLRINVRNLAEEMANAASVIEALSNYLVVLWDQKCEFQAEGC